MSHNSPKSIDQSISYEDHQKKSLFLQFLRQGYILNKVHTATLNYWSSEGGILDLKVVIGRNFYEFQEQALLPWSEVGPQVRSLTLEKRINYSNQGLPKGTKFSVYPYSLGTTEPSLQVKFGRRVEPIFTSESIHNHPPFPEQIEEKESRKKLSFSQNPQETSNSTSQISKACNLSSVDQLAGDIEGKLHLSTPSNFSSHQVTHLVIVDLEATCDYSPSPQVDRTNSEIIEFPWVVVDTSTTNIVYQQQLYVQPDQPRFITNYCTKLTGITRKHVQNAPNLKDALKQFKEFIQTEILKKGSSFCILCDGEWDLQCQLLIETRRKALPLDEHFHLFFDLKTEFSKLYPWFPAEYKPSLKSLLNAFQLNFVGRHHCGIDDCRTIAQLVQTFLKMGHKFTSPKKLDVISPDSAVPAFSSRAPQGAWQCQKSDCQIWNTPNYTYCRFCNSAHQGQLVSCHLCGLMFSYSGSISNLRQKSDRPTQLRSRQGREEVVVHEESLLCFECQRRSSPYQNARDTYTSYSTVYVPPPYPHRLSSHTNMRHSSSPIPYSTQNPYSYNWNSNGWNP